MLFFKKIFFFLVCSLTIFLFFYEFAFAVTFQIDNAVQKAESFVYKCFKSYLPSVLIIGGIGAILYELPEIKLFYLLLTIGGVLLYFVL